MKGGREGQHKCHSPTACLSLTHCPCDTHPLLECHSPTAHDVVIN